MATSVLGSGLLPAGVLSVQSVNAASLPSQATSSIHPPAAPATAAFPVYSPTLIQCENAFYKDH